MSTPGKRFKRARNISGLTQREAGERVGISHVAISRFEAGDKMPSLATVAKLAVALVQEAIDRRARGAKMTGLAVVGREDDGRNRYEVTIERRGVTTPLPIQGRRPLPDPQQVLWRPKHAQFDLLGDFVDSAVENILRGEVGDALGELVVREMAAAIQEGRV